MGKSRSCVPMTNNFIAFFLQLSFSSLHGLYTDSYNSLCKSCKFSIQIDLFIFYSFFCKYMCQGQSMDRTRLLTMMILVVYPTTSISTVDICQQLSLLHCSIEIDHINRQVRHRTPSHIVESICNNNMAPIKDPEQVEKRGREGWRLLTHSVHRGEGE